jgi:hypothetical protein
MIEPIRPNKTTLTDRELSQVLAALRFWQKKQEPDNIFNLLAIKEEWEHFEECEPMTTEEIDTLCERFNLGPIPEEKNKLFRP